MVDVTTEALQTVKNALATFQSDISGLSMRATNDTDDIVNECKAKITQTKSEIAQVETQISVINQQINELESKIEQTTAQHNTLTARIPQLMNNIRSLGSKISILNSQISSLRSQLANTEGDEERQQIQEQISALDNQVSQCEAKRAQMETELQNSEQRKSELQQAINSAKSQKTQCESELSVQKNRCNKMKDKFERLKRTFTRVEADLKDYVSATKKFESGSAEKAQHNRSSIDKCLYSINEYLSSNFGLGHVSTSNIENYPSEHQAATVSDNRTYPYSSVEDLPDKIFDRCADYRDNCWDNYNIPIRTGRTSHKIKELKKIISAHHLAETTKFVRTASLKDLGELAETPLDELEGKSYPFLGFMSASPPDKPQNLDNVYFEITAPSGYPALDLTNINHFNEVIFDSPTCYIERVETHGNNTPHIFITLK